MYGGARFDLLKERLELAPDDQQKWRKAISVKYAPSICESALSCMTGSLPLSFIKVICCRVALIFHIQFNAIMEFFVFPLNSNRLPVKYNVP